jgi:hypothetical protein
MLGPFKFDEKFELVMVMVVFPLVVNAIQFWVIDNFLKLPDDKTKEIVDKLPESKPVEKNDAESDSNKESVGTTDNVESNNEYKPPVIDDETRTEEGFSEIKLEKHEEKI